MSVSMGPPSVSGGGGPAKGMRSGVTRKEGGGGKAIRGIEAKLVGVLSDAMDKISFDANMFAFLMSSMSANAQMRFMSILFVWFTFLAEKFEKGYWEDENEMEVMANGARFRDAMEPFM